MIQKEVKKAAKVTNKKVTSMRESYIDGKWSSKSELLEWMGFYTGAALVHWSLIAGAAEEMKNKELQLLSNDAIEFYNSLFSLDEKKLYKIGASSVT